MTPVSAARRVRSPTLGLGVANNMQKGGIYIGFIPGFGEQLDPSTPQDVQARLPRPMALMSDYVALDASDSNLSSVDHHIGALQALPGHPVYSCALMPNQGLDSITPTVANNIARKMKSLNDKGITVWLRFAHEMNGDWYAWGQQPTEFLAKWKLVANAVRAGTVDTYMLWSPNSYFGTSLDDVHGGWSKYWPGASYVDIVGMSFYHYGGYSRLNIMPTTNEAINMVAKFDQLYGSVQGKPVILSETSASYTYNLQTHRPGPGGATEYNIKMAWLKQLLDGSLKRAVPSLRAITIFEIIKDETAAGNSPLKTEDFRMVLAANKTLSHDAISFIDSP